MPERRTERLRDAYGEVLVELGADDPDIVAMTADLGGSTRVQRFGETYPDRYFNMGVAEANMMAAAAGLAMSGKRVFASTFAIFATGKPWEQIRQTIAYQNAPVRIVATHAGLTVGEDGASHQMLEDVNNMRVMPNMSVIVPADSVETRQVIRFVHTHDDGPVYVRLTRAAFPVLFAEPPLDDYRFEFGKAQTIRPGDDLTLFACGLMVSRALDAADILAADGVSARVVNVSTIKPLDEQAVARCARETGAAVTVEEHNIEGGLGSAIAAALGEHQPVPMQRLGTTRFGESGAAYQLIDHFGLTADRIAAAGHKVLARKEEAS